MIPFHEYCCRRAIGRDIEEAYRLLPKIGINPDIYVKYLYEHPELWSKDPKDVLNSYDEVNWGASTVGAGLGGVLGGAAGSLLGPAGTWAGGAAGSALGGAAGNYASRAWGGLKGMASKAGAKFNATQYQALLNKAKDPNIQKTVLAQPGGAAALQKLKDMQAQAAKQGTEGGWKQGWNDQEAQQALSKIFAITGGQQQQQEEPQQNQNQSQDQWSGSGRLGGRTQQQQFKFGPEQMQTFQAALSKTLPEVIARALQQAQGG